MMNRKVTQTKFPSINDKSTRSNLKSRYCSRSKNEKRLLQKQEEKCIDPKRHSRPPAKKSRRYAERRGSRQAAASICINRVPILAALNISDFLLQSDCLQSHEKKLCFGVGGFQKCT